MIIVGSSTKGYYDCSFWGVLNFLFQILVDWVFTAFPNAQRPLQKPWAAVTPDFKDVIATSLNFLTGAYFDD